MEKAIEAKLTKLLTLSRKGVKGEAVNAKIMLDKLLLKYDLTIEDIDSDIRKDRVFKYCTNEEQTIIAQICYRVLNAPPEIYINKGIKRLYVSLSDYENVQVIELIDFHLENYRKERKLQIEAFRDAYIQKHRLFREDTTEVKRERDLSYEEQMKLMRMFGVMDTLSNKSYVKKLE